MCAFYLEIIHWNAAIIVMVLFGAHSIKDVSRVQVLQNCMQLQKREILKLDKKEMIRLVAEMFVRKNLVSIEGNMDTETLKRDKVIENGVF